MKKSQKQGREIVTMNADAFRHLYGYHFSENLALWDKHVMAMSPGQFTQAIDYSTGSVKHHVVHMMSVDNTWFAGLRGDPIPEPLNPQDFEGREAIRAYWDTVIQQMRVYLDSLTDEQLCDKPFADGEDEDLIVWQVLLQVVNHGTDHRSQLLRILHEFGQKTVSQDYIFYVYDNPLLSTE